MQALVIHAAGDLRLETIATPELGAQQLLVRVRCGGICGSDLHYYQHGGFGTIRVKEPMVLGHEVAGVIGAVGSGVTQFSVGERIAVSPSQPCGLCSYCQKGLQNHCLDMRYYGSAMRTPHVQGAFRQEIVVEQHQAHRLAAGVSDSEGAMVEPLAVALHAVRRAGSLVGKNVLITGCGPIGALLIVAARRAGAGKIVVTDMGDFTLGKALKVGADEVINMSDKPEGLDRFSTDKGHFDVLFEASGNQHALCGALAALRPRGVIVQVGLGGEMNLPMNTLVAKEFDLRGAFRFHEEFAMAVELLNKGLVDVKPLISATLSFRDSAKAFTLAADRSQAMKVLLNFD
ncbi:L-idonate 5-dehydrogenase (NAD(P)(+)) [Polaromonas vacuolata]|uniref:L-idonate 5-dehydrogenase (NAD(P)(+)) n=1 Tax=Polaromonas vacuolata TaxID=37448 RepID=A0A6H2HBA3_9BURK|nr:L-idonate 5-dehydrogenase [Polaromonas vacuolata]QJC56874.1 L-idonate 5-dehydrogenase (NAD(P)(+)) [Polaromonas vacuolata]